MTSAANLLLHEQPAEVIKRYQKSLSYKWKRGEKGMLSDLKSGTYSFLEISIISQKKTLGKMNILLQRAIYVHKATHIYNNNFPLHLKFILAALMISQDNSYLKLVQTAQQPQSKKATAVFAIWQHSSA